MFFISDRNRINQDHVNLKTLELKELTHRHQGLMDQFTRVDVECSRVADELAIANGRLEQMRNECANLRAEKKIWENVQTRLLDENKLLSLERSRMADLIANVQKLHNDIDKSNESDRRRFETRIQDLESQTHDLRNSLNRERESARQITLQKDLEVQELRAKIDRNVESLSKAREGLVEAETSRKHLQERVDELVKQVQTSEEKLAVYERRTTTITASGSAQSASATEGTNEEQLRAEVAELRCVFCKIF